MNKPPTSALVTVAVVAVIVAMVVMPTAVTAADLPMWLDLLARAVFCLWWGVQSCLALIDSAEQGRRDGWDV